jgi:hypothetical protein
VGEGFMMYDIRFMILDIGNWKIETLNSEHGTLNGIRDIWV